MIDPELATFLEDGLGIHIGTRNGQLEPNGTRAAAATIDDDGRHLVVYLASIAAARVMPDLESNGQAALTFARPTDERTVQVKGVFVSARGAQSDERTLVSTQWERFLDKLEAIGIPRAGASAWIWWPAVAIRLQATAIFEQTPGAKAGTQIA